MILVLLFLWRFCFFSFFFFRFFFCVEMWRCKRCKSAQTEQNWNKLVRRKREVQQKFNILYTNSKLLCLEAIGTKRNVEGKERCRRRKSYVTSIMRKSDQSEAETRSTSALHRSRVMFLLCFARPRGSCRQLISEAIGPTPLASLIHVYMNMYICVDRENGFLGPIP